MEAEVRPAKRPLWVDCGRRLPVAEARTHGYASEMRSDPFDRWLERWRLTLDGEPFTTPHSKSQLLPVLRDGERAILKIAGDEEERRGADLMEWYGGVGAARVLARDGDALLLERLMEGRRLSELVRSNKDDEATCILCQTARTLHAPRGKEPPASLVPLAAWCRALEPAANLHGGVFSKAATALRPLLRDPRDPVVLHGDIHHDNVLDGGQRGWLVIDPKGVFGERASEYANLFRNPDTATALKPGRMRRRAQIVADQAGLEAKRLCSGLLPMRAWARLGVLRVARTQNLAFVSPRLKQPN